ncbi:MAG: NRDE family protein [Bacteroidetes bacterium]|nr:NRDE family protein [Fibrella sp.]
MCVVTLLPIANGFLLTTNRDEHTSRSAAIPPRTYAVNDQLLTFPKDPQGGGTWLAASKTQLICLLNGAFPTDKPRVGSKPRKSRGLVVLDAFGYDDPYQFADRYDFGGVEPCTLVIARLSGQQQHLFELRWTGQQVWLRPLDGRNPHIWSSYTLYDAGAVALRKIWFTQFLQENHNHYTPDRLFTFHRTAGNGDPSRDFVMNRPSDGVRTVSLTQVAHTQQAGTMRYFDLALATETRIAI